MAAWLDQENMLIAISECAGRAETQGVIWSMRVYMRPR